MANRPRRSLTESAAAVSRSANALDTQDADRLERDAAAKSQAEAQAATARAATAATSQGDLASPVTARSAPSAQTAQVPPSAAAPTELARRLPIGDIKLRDANTRPLNLAHVIRLAESIMVLGIIEDIVIDQEGVLVDGGHRHAAATLLACMAKKIDRSVFCGLFPDETPTVVLKAVDRFSMHESLGRMPSPEEMVQREHDIMEAYADHIAFGVPVTRRLITDPAQRLGMEVAANEHRRNYTGEEIRGIADRLRNAGYVEKPGRPVRARSHCAKHSKPSSDGRTIRCFACSIRKRPRRPRNEMPSAFCVRPLTASCSPRWPGRSSASLRLGMSRILNSCGRESIPWSLPKAHDFETYPNG